MLQLRILALSSSLALPIDLSHCDFALLFKYLVWLRVLDSVEIVGVGFLLLAVELDLVGVLASASRISV